MVEIKYKIRIACCFIIFFATSSMTIAEQSIDQNSSAIKMYSAGQNGGWSDWEVGIFWQETGKLEFYGNNLSLFGINDLECRIKIQTSSSNGSNEGWEVKVTGKYGSSEKQWFYKSGKTHGTLLEYTFTVPIYSSGTYLSQIKFYTKGYDLEPWWWPRIKFDKIYLAAFPNNLDEYDLEPVFNFDISSDEYAGFQNLKIKASSYTYYPLILSTGDGGFGLLLNDSYIGDITSTSSVITVSDKNRVHAGTNTLKFVVKWGGSGYIIPSCGLTVTTNWIRGTLSIDTTPVKGGVYVNNNYWGVAPQKKDLDSGTYTVSFGSVSGYNTPPPISATVSAGQTRYVTGTYTVQKGTLSVFTTPVNGGVYVNGVYWGISSQKKDLDPGTYTVLFDEVAGYVRPGNQTVTVYAGQTTYVTGTYNPQKGTLSVFTTPVNGDIYVSGSHWGIAPQSKQLDPGTYTVTFGGVSGYTTPPNQTVTVESGKTTTVTGTYISQKGTLSISTTPVNGKVYVNSIDWGITPQRDIDPGTYTVSFGPVEGYEVPPEQTAIVYSNQTTSVIGTYIEQTGMLKVQTTPINGGIYVNDEYWGIAPQSKNLRPGVYTVTFAPVPGYIFPVTQTPSVSPGGITEIIGTYDEMEFNRIDGVPNYQQNDYPPPPAPSEDNDCVPTAAACVLGYWDDHGYTNLIDGGTSTTGNEAALVADLKQAMQYSNGTLISRIDSGIQSICNDTTYGNQYVFTAQNLSAPPTWNDIKNEIDAGRPAVYTVNHAHYYPAGGFLHSVALVGYERTSTTDSVVVNDNNVRGISVPWEIDEISNAILTRVTPGGASWADVTISPNSGQAGDNIMASGRNLIPNRNITFKWDGWDISTNPQQVSSLNDGSFSGVAITVPASPIGLHTILVTDPDPIHGIPVHAVANEFIVLETTNIPEGGSGGPSFAGSAPLLSFDGNMQTYWQGSSNAEQWQLIYAFKNEEFIVNVTTYYLGNEYLPAQYGVYYSSDGVNWSSALGRSGMPVENTSQHSVDVYARAKYILVNMKAPIPSGYPAVQEIVITLGIPVAKVGGPYITTEGSAVIFDASQSYDPDEGILQYRWDFENDGIYDTTWSNNPTASYTWNDEHSGTVRVEITDGEYYTTDTSTVTINNVPPSQPIIDITPNSPTKIDNLTCTIITPSTDPGENDIITYTYHWTSTAGDDIIHGPTKSLIDTIPYSEISKDEVWTCEVIPNDGTADGLSGKDYVIILNTAPIVTITSPNGGEIWSGARDITWVASDIDGDILSFKLQYTITPEEWIDISTLSDIRTYSWDTKTGGGDSSAYLIRIIAEDGDGGFSNDVSNAYFRIDNTAPLTTDNYAFNEIWINTDGNIILTATDQEGSGVITTNFSSTGAEIFSDTGNILPPIVAEGTTIIIYYSIDAAGNIESPKTIIVNIDKTPPILTASTTPQPNEKGWNNTDVTITYTATDNLSGIDSAPFEQIIATEGSGQVVTATAIDKAGNSTQTTVTLNIDKTLPVITAVASPEPNINGWNNSDVTVSYTVTDSLSGIDESRSSYANDIVSTEGAGIVVNATVYDNAGNLATIAKTVNLDKTNPIIIVSSRTPANSWGWNNTSVTVTYAVEDYLSGVDRVIGGYEDDIVSTEGIGQSTTATVTDRAGNSASITVADINIDLTPPVIIPTLSPTPNANGWNNTDVTVSYSVSDSLSGIDSLISDYNSDIVSAEGIGIVTSGTVYDKAGNKSEALVSLNIDKTPPRVTTILDPEPNENNWNKTDVTVNFRATDNLAGIEEIDAPVAITSEGMGQIVTGGAIDKAGNRGVTSTTLNIDKTLPVIVAAPSPGPNEYGWNNQSVTINYTVTDNLSGADTPSPVILTNEGQNQLVTGITITDHAGNVSTPCADIYVSIDKTAPIITASSSPSPNKAGWNNTDVTVTYTCSDALSGIDIAPADQLITTEGRNQYITGTATDKAGNTASDAVTLNIDKTSPVTIPRISPTPNKNNWNNTLPVTVNFLVQDNLSGPAITPEPMYVNSEGIHLVDYYSTDVAGNVEPIKTITIKIDLIAPIVNITKVEEGTGNEFVEVAPMDEGKYFFYNINSDTNEDTLIRVSYTTEDPLLADGNIGSGIVKEVYLLNDEPYEDQNLEDEGVTLNLYQFAGYNTFKIEVTDAADNSNFDSIDFIITLIASVILEPEALKVNPGILTAFVQFPEGYDVKEIEGIDHEVGPFCDGALAERIMLNDDRTVMIMKFRRADIESALTQMNPPQSIDTSFTVIGSFGDGTADFEATGDIMKIVDE